MYVPRSKARYSALFEALEAARWRGLTDPEYDALSLDDKARLIAHYRTATRLEAVAAWEQAKELRRKHGR
jgi:Tfp pilus assembly protein PilN